jgi:hypothetical protein
VAAGGDIFWGNYAVLLYLESRKPKGAEPGILRRFRAQPSNTMLMRLVAAYRLAEAVPALKQQLLTDSGKLRTRHELSRPSTAARTLAAIGGTGREALAEALGAGNPFVARLYAAQALAGAGDARAYRPAVALLGELDEVGAALPPLAALDERTRTDLVRHFAHVLLGVCAAVGGDEGRRLIRRVAALHPDQAIRRDALWHLERLANQARK